MNSPHIPSVVSVMTPFPHAVDSDATVADAQGMMAEHGIRHLPVTRAGELYGIVCQRDVRLCLNLAQPATPLTVAAVCRTEPFVVDRAARLDEVLTALAEHDADAALVVRKGKLVGILTSTDIYRFLGARLHEFRPDPPDVVA